MSNLIAENVTYAYGAKEIIRKATFRLGESERIGLVGPNGEGKSTLLKLIGGMLEPIGGEIHRSRGLRIGYLPQDPPALEGSTIYDAMLEVFRQRREMEQQLHEMAAQMEQDHEDQELLQRYGALQTQFEDLGGYDYTNRIEQVLTGLAFDRAMWDQPLSKLSGGQRTRAYLARLLLESPDVLMLDEPTNHLDIDSVEWLEGWMESFKGTLVVVSHDRYFLDRVTNNTWEIAFAHLEAYRGSYSEYLPKRQQRFEERMAQWQAQQDYIAKTEDFIRQHISGQRSKEAQGRRTRLERFIRDEAVDQPQQAQTISLSIVAGRRSGDMVLEASDISVGYSADAPLVQAEQLKLHRGERIAIVGANGIGKTTLLRSLLGELDMLGGTVRLGTNVDPGYLSQTHAQLSPEMTAADAVSTKGHCTSEKARSLLGALLLSGDDAFKTVSELSGGQRSRIVLAQLSAGNPNLLLLDEPTNHLDIPSTEVIQNVLENFEGAALFVSHDRYLVQRVATHIWAIDDGQVYRIHGGWEAYLNWRQQRRQQTVTTQNPEQQQAQQEKEQRKTDYKEARKRANLLQRLQRRHQQLEEEIDQTETRLAEVNDEISTAGESGDMQRIEELGKEYEKLNAHLQQLWHEWEDVGLQLE